VDTAILRDFARSSHLEWLETNGTGAFAMGTVAGVSTRRYHALLIASLNPPVERYATLSRVEEDVAIGGATFELGACQYPGTVAPQGYQYLYDFRADPCATWIYALNDAKVEKQVYLVEGRQAVVLRYRANRACTLRIRLFLAYRDYHSLTHENDSLNGSVEQWPGIVRVEPYSSLPAIEFHSSGGFTEDGKWYRNVEYLVDLDRGLDFREDLYTPGFLTFELEPGEWKEICASIDGTRAGDMPAVKRDPFLVRRADGHLTVIAGYPWFTDWGRDTMISLPGLLIAKGRLQEAREIIEGFLKHRNRGVIPNRFPDGGQEPEYNTADATLWMFQTVRQWLASGGDRAFLRDVFYPAAKEIVDWHMRGTWFGIQADPQDGLLNAGVPGTQLTWMDAKRGDWVVTPRHGKPVEINALWHGALCSMVEWASDLGYSMDAPQYEAEALRVRASFREKFWNPARGYLNDVLHAEGPVAKLRPNQIFAVSLPYDLLSPEQQRGVVETVRERLLVPEGLRTLDRDDPEYCPRYEGPPHERDGAYHQGTVWPWLLGPYIDAYLRVFGASKSNLELCRDLVTRLEQDCQERGCLGSIAEIYDAEEPRYPRGCPAQAWSVAEASRVRASYGWLMPDSRANIRPEFCESV
jgi:glycogen debranching enzyme